MNYPSKTKTCPHCKVQLQPEQGVFGLVRKGAGGSDSSSSLPVSLYSCPQCGYIETYNLRVTGRI